MRYYPENFKLKIKFFLDLSMKSKVKKILSFFGIRFFLNFIFFNLYKFIYKNNYPFLKGILFDSLKFKTKTQIIETNKNERFLIFTNDNIISKEMFVSEEFDLKKLEKTLNFLNTKNKISKLYDIGANIGVICIPALTRNYVKKALAVEPEKNNFDLLKMNIALNNLEKKIDLFNFALSDKDDHFIEMELAPENSGDHRIRENVQFNIHGEEKRKTVSVKTKKFDTLFKEINPKEDLIWMDTQGYEPTILSGANNLINSKAPIVIEFWPYALKRSGLWESMFIHIKKFDYFLDLSEKVIKLVEINENTINQLKNGWGEEKKGFYSLYTDLLLVKN